MKNGTAFLLVKTMLLGIVFKGGVWADNTPLFGKVINVSKNDT